MEKLFDNKTAFITGGGTGIGRACAIAFAAEGEMVTVAGGTETTLQETVESIKAAGGKARYAICDVRWSGCARARRVLSPASRCR